MRPLPDGGLDIVDEAMLDAIVKLAFSRRRKTLKNALSGLAEPGDLDSAGLDPGMRPEQMAPYLERFAMEVAPRLKAAV